MAASRLAVEGYADTLQHLGLLKRKRDQLRTAQMDAERQHLHRIACAYDAGVIDKDDLVEIYEEFRALADDGYSHRWNAEMRVTAAQIQAYSYRQAHRRPNGPHGTWEGVYPFASDTTPGVHTCVVYILFDSANAPCYVGSTQHFRKRLNWHAADGKQFTYWRAQPCADRAAAYALETQLLRQHKPYLNKRAA